MVSEVAGPALKNDIHGTDKEAITYCYNGGLGYKHRAGKWLGEAVAGQSDGIPRDPKLGRGDLSTRESASKKFVNASLS